MSTRKDYWKKVRGSALEQLVKLRAERDKRAAELNALNTEIVELEQVLDSLTPLTSEEPQDDTIRVQGIADLELADAIREVLKQSEQYRTPRGVRDSLKVSEYDLDQHPNPLASVHGVLKRLVEAGEVTQLNAKGKTYYRWRTEPSVRLTRVDIVRGKKSS